MINVVLLLFLAYFLASTFGFYLLLSGSLKRREQGLSHREVSEAKYLSAILFIIITSLFVFSVANYMYFILNDAFRDLVFLYQVVNFGHYSSVHVFYPVSFPVFLNTIIVHITDLEPIITSRVLGYLMFLLLIATGGLTLRTLLNRSVSFWHIYLASPLIYYLFLGVIAQEMALVFLAFMLYLMLRKRLLQGPTISTLVLSVILSVAITLSHPTTSLHLIALLSAVIIAHALHNSRNGVLDSFINDSKITLLMLSISISIYIIYTQIAYGLTDIAMTVFQKVMKALGSPLPETVSVREVQPYDLLLKYLGTLTLLSMSTILFVKVVSCSNVIKDSITTLFIKTTYIVNSSLIILGYLLSSIGGPSSIYRYMLLPSIYLLSLHVAIYSSLLRGNLRKTFTTMIIAIILLSLLSGAIPIEEFNITKTPYSPTTGEPFKNDIITSLSSILDVKHFARGYYVLWLKLPLLRGVVLKNIINNQEAMVVEQITETIYVVHYKEISIRWRGTEEECVQEKSANTFYVLSSQCGIQLNALWSDGRYIIAG